MKSFKKFGYSSCKVLFLGRFFFVCLFGLVLFCFCFRPILTNEKCYRSFCDRIHQSSSRYYFDFYLFADLSVRGPCPYFCISLLASMSCSLFPFEWKCFHSEGCVEDVKHSLGTVSTPVEESNIYLSCFITDTHY